MIVYGKQIFTYIVDKHPHIIKHVYVSKELDKKDFAKLRALGIKVVRVDNKKAQSLSRGGNHQGVLLEIDDFLFATLQSIKEESFLVLLYGVTDVGNIGSIVRSAYALGAGGVVVSGLKSLKMEGVIRRSSGAALDLPIVLYPNLLDLMKELQDSGTKIYGADMQGEDVRKVHFVGKRAILLGSEGEGLPKKALQKCDKRLQIKMEREFDSLNVAAAAAIFIDRMRDG
ncbi:23S rRNA (guanosine(2251)-2'-O)-methyltransferase RlmB [Nitratiruptor tergarcus]|uniref:23S rRNA (Guanosine2251-2'-O)-methyltransferase n=1 Tax=Nitratiruptor tergarcus DSM 16512 TaxID=1069081 RepID=A0A1W1WQ78_9BACT|nr:23S rRNA (guanosine(2251)-2'-O)-methyltransferase RlmB [Nitratiruptor tergarcus]SMC08365.1 23S rRNA (guanosine2251-2'-O)-methyltransferase [Nitratiruptor tergarcus DSM 16512]